MALRDLPGSRWIKADIFELGTWPRDGQRIFACTQGQFMFFGRFQRSRAMVYSDLYDHRPIPFALLLAWQDADEKSSRKTQGE